MNVLKPNSLAFICCVLFALMVSSCSTSRETVSSRRIRSAERDQLSRRLNMPLTGRENPALIRESASWIGTPYRIGGNTRAGVDCSGFVWAVHRNVYGTSLPRTTEEMAKQTRRVRKNRLREGDLVFFRTQRRSISHVGIYLGNGYFVHASTNGGVMVNRLDERYYARRFVRGGRP